MENMNIYKMELHESLEITDENTGVSCYIVTRVPGGWIYTLWIDGNPANPVFVPYDNQFQK